MSNSPDTARAWTERVRIPTYGTGSPDPNPMFLEKRVYQGSSGAVYPYPVVASVSDAAQEQEWEAVFLENRWLKVMILPQLGGRVQMALNKANGRHFVYYNRVIKPALVGLCGPWISGGIEFNWPQHHRPNTYGPVDWRIEHGPDGTATVWCSEIEKMSRTRGTHGFRLHPGRAVLEIDVRIYNRTAEPQTFLWWANPAVAVNGDYQSVFPPDVHAVMDHGKRAVSEFPIARGEYYKVNYAPGTDISRYKNIPVPTSYMAYHSDFDFVGCYDHGIGAGMMHVADHHFVPGKKQWTWGNGDFGKTWDRELTDGDGPYIELMCGAFTDNQPDFSWLMPGEEKRFTQNFLPYAHTGGASNATTEAVIHLEPGTDSARFGVYVTEAREVGVELALDGRVLFAKTVALDPAAALVESVPLPAGCEKTALRLAVYSGGNELVSFSPLPAARPEIPDSATPAPDPADVGSNEELYLHGLHLEQYRHATRAPEPYYEEALRRDPGDSRCNNALGLLAFRRGRFVEAEVFFRKAVARLTMRNPNPCEGEAYYNLGLALRMRERWEEASDALHKACWNEAWKAPAYFELARISCRRRDWAGAVRRLDDCLVRNAHHHKARHLRAAALRKCGRAADAGREIRDALELDPMNFGAMFEQSLSGGGGGWREAMRDDAHNRIEIALDYAHAGLRDEADALLDGLPDPMAGYYRGWIAAQAGDETPARAHFAAAARLPVRGCFPFRIECVPALETAMRLQPDDPHAPYLLGNFRYARRGHAEAVRLWERSAELDPVFPTVHRNLALAYMNKAGDAVRARASMERAHAADPADARVFFELDQLYKHINRPVAERLVGLEARRDLVLQRDDLAVEFINLLNLAGRHREALDLLLARRFHPWEGGEGKVSGQYVLSRVALARAAMAEGDLPGALGHLEAALSFPPNLGEGKLPGARENQVQYHLGKVLAAMGRGERAAAWFTAASQGSTEPAPAMFYNDQPPEMIFYQGLALRALGREGAARAVFEKLLSYGDAHMGDEVRIDYFAVSLPDFLVFEQDLGVRNRVHCHTLRGLGLLGLGRTDGALAAFDAALALRADHIAAAAHRALVLQGFRA